MGRERAEFSQPEHTCKQHSEQETELRQPSLPLGVTHFKSVDSTQETTILISNRVD